jgi:hypothetical protein
MHLLIPFAQCRSPLSQTAFDALVLPQFNRLLGQLQPVNTDAGDENSLSPPHERALAAAYGFGGNGSAIADGCLPWGAWHARRAGLLADSTSPAWAVITPAQWAVQTNHITMADPAALQLLEADSRALLAVMAPYFSEDGIRLVYDTPTRWLASGEVFRGLATASVDRVVGRHVDDWLPKSAPAKPLRRLQQEMQMLLYTHALTEARAAQGLPAVNSFWVSGTGALAQNIEPVTDIVCPSGLRDAAVNENWPAWAQAWQVIDAIECAAALAALQRAEPVAVTLCGERSACRFERGSANPLQRLKRIFSRISGRQVTDNMRNQL